MIKVLNIKNGILLGILNLNEFAIKNKLLVKREIESQGKTFLIKELLGKAVDILYTENGKPYLLNYTAHISISHSHDKLAIIVNEKETTGIDIEIIRDKILNIKHKFLSEIELTDAANDVEKLLIYWAAKETLYKIYGLKEVSFITHLFVKSFNKYNFGTIIGRITLPNFKEQYELCYKIIDNYVLVYALTKL